MTEQWKVGDVAVINRRYPVEVLVGRAVVLKHPYGEMWVVVMAADGDEHIIYSHELGRP